MKLKNKLLSIFIFLIFSFVFSSGFMFEDNMTPLMSNGSIILPPVYSNALWYGIKGSRLDFQDENVNNYAFGNYGVPDAQAVCPVLTSTGTNEYVLENSGNIVYNYGGENDVRGYFYIGSSGSNRAICAFVCGFVYACLSAKCLYGRS